MVKNTAQENNASVNGYVSENLPELSANLALTWHIPNTQNYVLPDGTKIVTELNPDVRAAFVASFKRELCALFGGFTARDSTGGWVDSDTQELIEEHVTEITTFASYDAVSANVKEVLNLARLIRDNFQQDAVCFRINRADVRFI